MKKIGFFIFLLVVTVVFSACKKEFSHQKDDEKLLNGVNQIIVMINNAFLGENSLFSGRGTINTLSSTITSEIVFTGNLLFSGQELDGDIDLFMQQTGTEIGKQVILSLISQIRKSENDLYFFPKNFAFSQGVGNIQSKFLQLIFNGLLEQWVKVEKIQLPFSGMGKKLALIPQCFSGSDFQSGILNTYFSQQGDNFQFLSGTIKIEKDKRLFEQTIRKVNEKELVFSGDFDGKFLKGTFREWRGFPLEIELTIKENQFFCSGKWGTKSFQATLSVLDNQQFKLQGWLGKGENRQERSEFSFCFSHIQQTGALQSLPNTYISLEKYLEDLNINF